MPDNSETKMVGSRIPMGLVDRLQGVADATHRTQAEVIRLAIEAYLDAEEGKQTLEQQVEANTQRIEALEQQLANAGAFPPSAPPQAKVEPTQPEPAHTPVGQTHAGGQPLTTGEAYEAVAALGYTKAKTSFRRALKNARESKQLPADLTALGLRADWTTRDAANPKSNSVQWLSIEE